MNAAVRRVPEFVVAGAGRAGTTSVIEALRGHPRVFVTTPKEPHYVAFGSDFADFAGPGDDVTINRVAIRDEEQYRRLFAGADSNLAGEGSVSTLYHYDSAIPRLHALNGDVRVIIMLREPVARAQSAFQYLVARGLETAPDLVTAAAMEDERVAARWHHLWHYRRMSLYNESVAAFREAFGADQVGVWFYEDFSMNGEAVMSEIIGFLGLPAADWNAEGLRRVNVSGAPRSALLQRAIRSAGAKPAVRDSLKRVVPFHVRERIRLANLRPVPVTPGERDWFGETFEADSARLSEQLGRPLPWAR